MTAAGTPAPPSHFDRDRLQSHEVAEIAVVVTGLGRREFKRWFGIEVETLGSAR